VLRFHYSRASRRFADEQRAHRAHARSAGGYEALLEKMDAEIAIREERVGNLEEALGE
jgi:hypothetical protein